jgi:hypothetical protein
VDDGDDFLTHARLRTALNAYLALAALRRVQELSVRQLITHQRMRAVLCEMTGHPDPDLACQQARQLLGLPEPDTASSAPPPAPRQYAQRRTSKPPAAGTSKRSMSGAKPTPTAKKPSVAGASASGRPRAHATSTSISTAPSSVPCLVCGQRLPARLAARGFTVHPLCQPVPCRACHRSFPRTALVNQRCAACSEKPTPPQKPARRRLKGARFWPKGQARQRSLLERANREQQEAQPGEAKQVPKRPRRSVCSVCGNHGDHQCGRQWRLADGRIGKRPRRKGSVWTVRGGLPSLGKRSH